MNRISSVLLAPLFLSASCLASSLKIDLDSTDSIKQAAKLVAQDLIASYYTGGEIPGILPGPPPDGDYYWWTGGALWTAMLDYRARTGDTQFDDTISEGLMWQTGDDYDFAPANWTASEGNDDQAVWAMAALTAAETGFADPAKDGAPSWADMAMNVFNVQSSTARRVGEDAGKCSGALRWQIFPFNTGYGYVNSISNVAYADVGARLNLLDSNDTQSKDVQDTFSTLQTVGIIDDDSNVLDGAQVANNCSDITPYQFSFPAALALEAASAMYNATNADDEWKTILDGLLSRTTKVFFDNDGVAAEPACEPDRCTTDMSFYKFYLHRGLASTMAAAPYTTDAILPLLKSSAAAAAETCQDDGSKCSSIWSGDADQESGAGSQISVLGALLSLLPSVEGTGSSDGGDGTDNGDGGPSSTPTGSDSSPASPSPTGAAGHATVSAATLLLLCSLTLPSLLI